MKKFLIVVSLFLMLKTGQELKFHDGYSFSLTGRTITISDGMDNLGIGTDEIVWITDDQATHERLKGLYK
jgi:hypothetical protein